MPDPFADGRTSLVEAARRGFVAGGSELNRAAVISARVYRLVNLDATGRAAVLDRLHALLLDAVGSPHGPSFSGEEQGLNDRAALADCPQ